MKFFKILGAKTPKSKSATGKTTVARKPWHAVEVMGGPGCCQPARGIKGRRFLSKLTPPNVPLPGCDRPHACACRYVHHDDRRVGPRRMEWSGGFASWQFEGLVSARGPGKQRRSRGRRRDD